MHAPPGTRVPGQSAQFAVIDLVTGEEVNLDAFKAGGADLIEGRWMPFAIVTRTVPLQGTQMFYDHVQRTTYAAQNFETPPVTSGAVGEHLWVHQIDRNTNPSDYDIFAYDLVAGKDSPIIVRPGAQTFPKLAGRWLAYLDFANQFGEIRLHNLDTAEDFALGTVLQGYAGSYAIDQNDVVWFSGQLNRFELHVYDIARRTQFLLHATFKGEPGVPSVSNGIVVYGDVGNWVVYDILRDSVIQTIPRDPNTHIATARMLGSRVVWDVTDPHLEKYFGMYSAAIVRGTTP
jgi:hypothetical protein